MHKFSKRFTASTARSTLSTFAVIAMVATSTAHASELTTSIPAQKGEDLLEALRRVHPCFDAPGVTIPLQILDDNPERVARGGRMVLARPTLKLPTSFLDPKVQCAPVAAAPKPATALPSAPPPEPAHSFRKGPEVHPAIEDLSPAPQQPPAQSSIAAVPAKKTEPMTEPVPAPVAHESSEAHGVHDAHGVQEAHGAQHAAEHEEHESPYKNQLTLVGILDFAKLSAVTGTGGALPNLVSNPQPGFELAYERELNPSWTVGFNYLAISTKFQDVDGLPFTELSSFLQEFMASATYHVTHHSQVTLSAGAAQVDELNYSPVDGSLTVDHNFRATSAFLFRQELATFSGFELFGGLGAQVFVPTDWSATSLGLGGLFRLTVERELTHRLGAELGILGAYERQQTSVEAHSELSVGFGLGLSFRF